MSRAAKLKLVSKFELLQQRKQLSAFLQAQQVARQQSEISRRLQDYYDDYANLNSVGTDRDVATLRNGSRFVGDLDRALVLQKQREKEAAEQLQREREAWLQMYSRNSALDRLISAAQLQEELQRQNREDADADDQWTTQFARKS